MYKIRVISAGSRDGDGGRVWPLKLSFGPGRGFRRAGAGWLFSFMQKIGLCRLALVVGGLLAGSARPALAWGVLGHRVVTQVAVYGLPAPMQAFYYRHLPALVRQSTAPDERRAQDPAEALRHVIYLDHYAERNPFAKIPRGFDEAATKFSADTLAKYGTLPWAVLDTQEKLVAAFRARDTLDIVRLSAELSFYAADACVPLRTTLNYDGQLTGQAGLLGLWETQLPERFLDKYKLFGPGARELPDPAAAVWAVLQSSYGFLTATYDLETKVAKGFTPRTKYAFAHRYGRTERRYADAFADAYEEQVGGMVAFRLKEAAPLVASLWLTAWTQAGKPDLGALMLPARLGKDEKERLTTELKAWKANTLAQDRLLLAQQKQAVAAETDDIEAAEADAPATPAAPASSGAVGGGVAPAAAAKVKVKIKTPDAGSEKVKAKP